MLADKPAKTPAVSAEESILSKNLGPQLKADTEKKAAAVIGVIVLFIGVWLTIQMSGVGLFRSSSSSGDGRAVMPSRIGDPAPVVTKAEYDKLRKGMSLGDARRIIGASGEELSRNDLAGTSTVMYGWTNSNGSNMNAMFQNDKLIQKAQFGLP